MATSITSSQKSVWGFSPQSIPGLALWLDAADASTVTGTASVTAWRDKSGLGNNATGGISPSYSSNAVQFNGLNTYLTTPVSAGTNTATYLFVF